MVCSPPWQSGFLNGRGRRGAQEGYISIRRTARAAETEKGASRILSPDTVNRIAARRGDRGLGLPNTTHAGRMPAGRCASLAGLRSQTAADAVVLIVALVLTWSLVGFAEQV
jgi:hypothetical protein